MCGSGTSAATVFVEVERRDQTGLHRFCASPCVAAVLSLPLRFRTRLGGHAYA